MKSSDLIEAIERFFNDIIGTLVPGMILIFSICYHFTNPVQISNIQVFPPNSTFSWMILVLFGYISGHFVISFGNMIVIRSVDFIIRFFRKRTSLKWLVPSHCIEYKEILKKISESSEFRIFQNILVGQNPKYVTSEQEKGNIHALRSIAMTLASEDTHIVYRFMFISLFNVGVSTVLLLFAIFQFFILLSNWLGLQLINYDPSVWSISLPIIISLFLLDRRYEFYSRALRVPFSMAIARAMSQKINKRDIQFINKNRNMNEYYVYLAGGFHSNWQDLLISRIKEIKFLDPRSHELTNEKAYTCWDLAAIERCDCIFAYFEADNPGGYALACEVGYAKALNKLVIFVDDKSGADKISEKYLKMLHEIADINYNNLEDGISFLEKYLKMKN